MKSRRRTRARTWEGIAGLAAAFFIFVLPFIFIALMAVKSKQEASFMSFSLPAKFMFWENLTEVIKARDYMLLTAYLNSIIITVGSVTLLVVFGAMVGFVLQRRRSSWNNIIYAFVLAGLMIPPAVVPTIWVLQQTGLFKTISGMILIQVAYGLSFSILLYRAFVASIPRELDEAALIEGARPWQVFFKVVFPLLKPVTLTNVVVQSVGIFNDFTNPLYYLPGKQNVTVQLTLYNFQSQFQSQFNLLFMNILLITIPPLIVFVFFNRQIVAGMTAGAVKG
jgi:raffinose/stachyose/melibiose transport system permease protein